MQEKDMSIASLMTLMKRDADEIIASGEKMSKRYNTEYDSFEAIDRRAHQMRLDIAAGRSDMTYEQVSEWYDQAIADEYNQPPVDVEPVEQRVNFPDQRDDREYSLSIHSDEYKARFQK